jgi:hypothetical protein
VCACVYGVCVCVRKGAGRVEWPCAGGSRGAHCRWCAVARGAPLNALAYTGAGRACSACAPLPVRQGRACGRAVGSRLKEFGVCGRRRATQLATLRTRLTARHLPDDQLTTYPDPAATGAELAQPIAVPGLELATGEGCSSRAPFPLRLKRAASFLDASLPVCCRPRPADRLADLLRRCCGVFVNLMRF